VSRIKSNHIASTVDPVVVAKNLDPRIPAVFGKKRKKEKNKKGKYPVRRAAWNKNPRRSYPVAAPSDFFSFYHRSRPI
jgi:hypothetical protein